jgi:hypothetical protein
MKASLLLLAVLAGGCFKPEIGSGHLRCGTAGQCPPGFHCADDRCWRDGDGPDLGEVDQAPDLTLPPAIVYPPAAVWTSSGGGSAGGSAGAHLNLSIGRKTTAGESIAPSGGKVTFGFFSNAAVE